jgi:hypothetical protein
MENQIESAERIETFFRGNDNGNYYYYDHLGGSLIIIVDNGCEKGIFIRCDSQCATIVRQYHKEIINGVPKEYRLYDELNRKEFFAVLDKVEVEISRNIP